MVRNNTTYRFITDHRGSVKMVVNTDTDAVVQEITYTAYGEVVSDTNPGFQPFYFAGGMYDQDTTLIRFGARDYDPETGSWIQRDPIRFDGGMNLYGYVGGDPVNFVDVTGLKLAPVTEQTQKLLDKSMKSTLFQKMLKEIEKDPDFVLNINDKWQGQFNYYHSGEKTCYVDHDRGVFIGHDRKSHSRPPEVGLIHEILHAYYHMKNDPRFRDENYIMGFEGDTIYNENAIRKELGVDPRTDRKN